MAKEKNTENKKPVRTKKFDINGKFIHIKVGNEKKPATDDDIASVEEKINDVIEANGLSCIVFVTHHGVEVSVY